MKSLLSQLIKCDALTSSVASFLVKAAESGKGILITGEEETALERTWLLNGLIQNLSPMTRIVVIEDGTKQPMDLCNEAMVRMKTKKYASSWTGAQKVELFNAGCRMRPDVIALEEADADLIPHLLNPSVTKLLSQTAKDPEVLWNFAKIISCKKVGNRSWGLEEYLKNFAEQFPVCIHLEYTKERSIMVARVLSPVVDGDVLTFSSLYDSATGKWVQ